MDTIVQKQELENRKLTQHLANFPNFIWEWFPNQHLKGGWKQDWVEGESNCNAFAVEASAHPTSFYGAG